MKTTKTKPTVKGTTAAPLQWCCFLFARWRGLIRVIRKRLRQWRFAGNAVSYRIPQAVTRIIQYHDGSCYPVCPRCSKSVDREYMSYCDRCGQRLGWRHFDQAEVCYPKMRK